MAAELSTANDTRQEDDVYRCKPCDISFPHLSLLKSHCAQVHSLHLMHKCPQCGKLFESSWLLDDHMNTHLDKAPFNCTVCSLSFAERITMTAHKFQTHKIKNYSCGECGGIYSRMGNLRTHMFIQHKKTQPQTIEKDGKNEPTKCGSETLFKCQICAKVFTSMTELSTHSVIHRGDAVFRCRQCDICFPNLLLLTNHVARAHKPGMHICPQCDKQFVRGWLLEDHMNVHSGKAPYNCSVCAMFFAERINMSVHKFSSHRNEDFICGDCGSFYKNVGDLRKHMFNQHRKSRPFWCDKCGDDFICTIDREEHLFKIHSAFHADVCTVCFLQFSGAEEVKTHQERAHFVKEIDCSDKQFDGLKAGNSEADVNSCKPFPCLYCKERFVTFSEAQTHIRTHGELKLEPVQMESETYMTNKDLTLSCSDTDGNLVPSDTNIKPYSCPDEKILLDNKKIESKPFHCPQCNKFYSTSSDLETHQNVHTSSESMKCFDGDFKSIKDDENSTDCDDDTKRCLCLACHKCFTSNSDLEVHMQTHIHVNI